ncbi:MAG TPA: hypothetical protein VGJ26_12340 [Pirellulales bacterium]|jgi:hypothetical protein
MRSWRKWFGDQPVNAIVIDPKSTEAERANVARLFPEAELSN